MPIYNREKVAVAAENNFTPYITIENGEEGVLTLSGTWAATVTLQCLLEGGDGTPLDIDSKTANGRFYFKGGGDKWRAGVKTGDYTSGTAAIALQG